MNLELVILGSGGHARVLLDILRRCTAVNIIGMTDRDTTRVGSVVNGVSVIGTDAILDEIPKSVHLVNGLGSISKIDSRAALFKKCQDRGFVFESVIHPGALVAGDVGLAQGVQLMAGVVVQVSSQIGENVLINTKASVDHDCVIGAHSHLAPGCTLSGEVVLGECVHVGTGANIIQGIRIGAHATIAAGATVISDVAPGQSVCGVPARKMTSDE